MPRPGCPCTILASLLHPLSSLLELLGQPLRPGRLLLELFIEQQRPGRPFFNLVIEMLGLPYPFFDSVLTLLKPAAGYLQLVLWAVRPGMPVIWILRSLVRGRTKWKIRASAGWADAKFWSHGFLEHHWHVRAGPYNREHLSWRDASGDDLGVIALMYLINEGPVPVGGYIEVGTERAVHKRCNNI